jgi:hypothetical protein
MAINREKKKSKSSLSAGGALVGQSSGGCKILPFRPVCARDPLQVKEPDYGNALADPAEGFSPEDHEYYPVVYVPVFAKEPNRIVSGWLKTTLLMAAFTAYTAAAIAVCLALG